LLPTGNQTNINKNGNEPIHFIYIDKLYETALTYSCLYHYENGSCNNDMTTVTVWSRSRMITKDKFRRFLAESRI
ncbi:hypothetical protein LSH36_22g08003, partial [Paralvinella palmiformis]